MGQVLFCEDDKGRPFVIALEPPHASVEDRKNILENPKVATHFNPAFVAAEIITDASVYKNPDYDLWIKAEKQFKGVEVMYHETVLYELLGNSIMANACFPVIKGYCLILIKVLKIRPCTIKLNF